MKRFLVIALIYTLNIMMFLFAKSAGAGASLELVRSPAVEVKTSKLVVKR